MRWPDLVGWTRAGPLERIRMIEDIVRAGRFRLASRESIDPAHIGWTFDLDPDTFLCDISVGRVFTRSEPVDDGAWVLVLPIMAWEVVPTAELVLVADARSGSGEVEQESTYERLLSASERRLRRAESNVESIHAALAEGMPAPVQTVVGVMLGINREVLRIVRDLHGIAALPAELPGVLTRLAIVAPEVADAIADEAQRDPLGSATRLVEMLRRLQSALVGGDRVEEAFTAAVATDDPLERAAKTTEGISAILGIVLLVRGLARGAPRMPTRVLRELEALEVETRALRVQAARAAQAERAAATPPSCSSSLPSSLPLCRSSPGRPPESSAHCEPCARPCTRRGATSTAKASAASSRPFRRRTPWPSCGRPGPSLPSTGPNSELVVAG